MDFFKSVLTGSRTGSDTGGSTRDKGVHSRGEDDPRNAPPPNQAGPSETGSEEDATMRHALVTPEKRGRSQHSDTSGRHTRSLERYRRKSEDFQKRNEDLQKRNLDRYKKKSEDLQKENEDLQKRDEDLQKRNDDLQKRNDDLQKRNDDFQKRTEDLEKRNDDANIALERKETEIRSLTQTKAKIERDLVNLNHTISQQNRDIASRQHKMAEQELYIRHLQSVEAMQKLSISELTKEISRSTSSINTVTRDDGYFDGEFASLASTIRQWVLRYFRGGPEVNHRDLPPKLQEAMSAVIASYRPVPNRLVTPKEIEASVTHMIIIWAFSSDSVFHMLGHRKPTLLKDLGGTDREKRELQIQLLNLVIQGSKFDSKIAAGIHDRTEGIHGLCVGLIKEGCQEKGEQALLQILQKAAQLAFETSRQVSYFNLPQIEPGTAFKGLFMEDTSDIVGEDEGNRSHAPPFLVQTVLSPPVCRHDLDEGGMILRNPVIVRKAMVTVDVPEM